MLLDTGQEQVWIIVGQKLINHSSHHMHSGFYLEKYVRGEGGEVRERSERKILGGS